MVHPVWYQKAEIYCISERAILEGFWPHCAQWPHLGTTHLRRNDENLHPKPSLKIGSVTKASLFWYWQQFKNLFFLRIKHFFVFTDEERRGYRFWFAGRRHQNFLGEGIRCVRDLALHKTLPIYNVIENKGPRHKPVIKVSVKIKNSKVNSSHLSSKPLRVKLLFNLGSLARNITPRN